MGRGGKYDKKAAKAEEKGGKAKPAKKGFGIPKYAFLSKASLAPYCDEEGNALWVGVKDSVAELLAPASILDKSTSKNSEMLARPGMALSLAAAALHHGGKVVVKGSAKKAIEELATRLESPEAAAFLEAAKVLNLGKSGTQSRAAVEKAVRRHVKFLQSGDEKLQKALVEAAASAAKVYLFAMHALEQKAFLGKATTWAKKWQRSGHPPREMKDWLKDSSNREKLEEALVDLVMAKVAKHKKVAKDESSSSRQAADSSSSGGGNKASSASSVAEKHKTSKKADKKKEKKKSKRSKKSEAASASQTDKKEDRKRKHSASASPVKATAPKAVVEIGSEAETSSVASPQAALAEWPAAEAAQMATEVKEALGNVADKKKRLPLSGLMALLDNLPAAVLTEAGFEKPRQDLKALSRLPKQETVRAVLEKLLELAQSRTALETAPPGTTAPAPPVEVHIHRVGGTSADGTKAAVREEDPVDSVEVPQGGTVSDALDLFFSAQGSEEDRKNRTVKALSEDSRLLTVIPETMPVATCNHIALLRKGG